MRDDHDRLDLVAVGSAWILDHIAAPLWMPVIAATLVAIRHWLDLLASTRRNQYASSTQRVTFEVLDRCFWRIGAVLGAYGAGLVLGRLG